jgi:hypothetical protein
MDLTEDVKEFLQENRLRDAKEINEEGYCRDFADMMWRKYPETELMATDINDASIEGHYFVFNRVDGRYYDSESPLGVRKPADLKYFKRRNSRHK